jgi:hypothetical protein
VAMVIATVLLFHPLLELGSTIGQVTISLSSLYYSSTTLAFPFDSPLDFPNLEIRVLVHRSCSLVHPCFVALG